MINSNITNRKYQKTGSLLIFILIFVIAILFRIIASQNLQINSYEASVLLHITDRIQSIPEGLSFLESLLIKSTYFVFGESDLAARIWASLVGSLLIWSPLYLSDRVRSSTKIALSILISLDPFIIVNSIQVGSNIFAVFALINLIGSIWNDKKLRTYFFLILLFISGRGAMLGMIICLGLWFISQDFAEKVNAIFRERMSTEDQGGNPTQKFLLLIFSGILILFCIAVMKLDISIIISNFVQILNSFFNKPFIGNKIFLNPIILFSYFPLLIYFVISVIKFYRQFETVFVKLLVGWILGLLILMTVNSYFKPIDLIWISLSVLVISIPLIQNYFSNLQIKNKTFNWSVLILCICLISLMMSFITLIYQGMFGYSQNNSLISIVSMLILIITLGVFISLQWDMNKMIKIFSSSIFIILSVIQIGFSYKAGGLGGDQSLELLWSGNIANLEQIQDQVIVQDQTKTTSNQRLKIALLKMIDNAVLWNLRDNDVREYKGSEIPKENQDIILSENEILGDTTQKYFGHKIIRNSYPVWVDAPLKNLFFADFWSWLFLRRSMTNDSFYFLYINAD